MNISIGTSTTAAVLAKQSTTISNKTSKQRFFTRWFFSLMILLVGASVNIAVGQASNYTWATLTGQSLYTITSPTVVTTVANGTLDDGNNIIPLPFTFTYNNIAYTQMTVTTNGYIVAGSVPGAISSTASLTTGTSGNPTFSIFGRDGNLNSAANGGSLTHGAATGDKYVFEIVKLAGAASGAVSATIYATMQVILYGPASSSPGKIEFIYGTSLGTPATPAGQVGIKDAAGQYLNGITGVANSSPATSATWPVSGTYYSFTPPAPCALPTAQPTGLTLTPSGLSVLNGSFTAASPAPTGYLVVRTTTNTAPVPVDVTTYTVGNSAIGYIESVGTATTFASTGLLASTTYYYWVFSYSNTNCSGGPLYLTGALTNSATTGACSISGTKTVGDAGADYPNLTQAVAALIANGITGPVILELNSGYPGVGEPSFPIVLGAVPCASGTNTITIRLAAGVGARTITSNSTVATFDINGGNYWTIDGRQGGTGSVRDLSISNTSNATGGTAIRFINEASNNTVTYTNLQSAFASSTSAVVLFSTTTGANGNDNNTISNNRIDGGASTAASPISGVAQNGIYSLGTTTNAAQNNSNNTISNNEILNNFVTGTAQTSTGILLAGGNTDWTITGNSIYQTNSRTATATATIYGIYINNSSSGNNFTVTNNFIGGSAANAGGTAWTVAGAFANRMTALALSVGTTTASSVQGNTIANFVFNTTIGATTVASTGLAGTWAGIAVGAGSVNVGNITGNTIGSTTGVGSISVTSSTNAGVLVGIGTLGTGVLNVSNNTVAGLTSIGTASVSHNIVGLLLSATGVAVTTVNNNTIGSTTLTQSIDASTVYTGTSSQYINGISNTGTGTVSITNNTVANLINRATNSVSASTGSIFRGIAVTSGIATAVTGNVVRDFTVAANSTSNTVHAVVGIYMNSSTAGAWAVSNNSVFNISNTFISATTNTYVTGIYAISSATGGGVVSSNKIYGINGASTNAIVTGISAGLGVVSYYNNTITLGTGSTTATIYGIKDSSISTNTPSIYHNTVYIGGTTTAGASNSFALNSGQATNAHIYQNNIFINARTNGAGTGKHYAVQVAGTAPNPAGLTINYNIYRATGTGGVFGRFNAADVADLTAWKAAVGQDANSKDLDPCLANPTAGTPDLHITNCAGAGSPADGAGILIAAVTDDMDGETRATLSPVDIGADAGIYGSTGLDVGISALVRPTATSCHSATEDVIVTLKNYSTTDIDFTLNPVDVTVNVTGQITAGPLTVTINTGTLLAGATQNVTVGQVNTTANGTYTFTSTTVLTGDVTPGNNANVTNVVINYTAFSAAATSGSPSICISGATSLLATPTGGTAPFTYLWDAGTTPTTAANNTGTITANTTYNVVVTDACGLTANASITITVNTPTVLTSTPGSRCGPGLVNLSATASGAAILNWYNTPTGGTSLATGPTYTPNVTSLGVTPFYVRASEGGSSGITIPGDGAWDHFTTSGSFQTTAITGAYMIFTVLQPLTLSSFDMYPSATLGSSFTLEARTGSASGTTYASFTGVTTVVNSGTPSILQTVPVNWVLPAGTYYIGFTTNPNTWRSGLATHTFPWTLAGYASMDFNLTPSYQYYLYNLKLSTGCESVSTTVNATVTTPPAIAALATPATICAGQSSVLSVTSSNDPDYTYSWSPAGPGSVSPTTSTTYTVNAIDNTAGPNAGCTVSQSVTVTVNPLPTVTASASTTTVCPNGTFNLTANSGGGTLLTQNFDGAVTGWTITNDGASPTQCNWYYQAAPFTDASGSATFLNFTTDNGGKFALSNADAGGSGSTTNTVLTSPVFSTVGVGAATLTFEHAYQSWTSGDSKVALEISTNGGTTWSVLQDYMGTSVGVTTSNAQVTAPASISLSGYLGQANLRIRFNYVSTWGYYWIIDNVNISGASAPFTYAWTSTPSGFTSAVQNPQNVIPTQAATYSVVATNTATNCPSLPSTTPLVNLSDLAITSAVTTNNTCFGQTIGSVTGTATGGTGPYTYTIAGPTVNATGASTGIFTGLAAGSYTITVTDAVPCSATSTSVTVTEPTQVTVGSPVTVDPTCFNGSNGTISITAAGGTAGYTYVIAGPTVNTTGDASGAYTGLTAGNYTITATDANGCTGTSATITLNNPAAIPVTASNNGPVCSGTDATLTIAETYVTYSWTGPGTINTANSQTATAVAPANGDVFTITVTDGLGCSNSATTTVTVTPNDPVSVSISVAPSLEVCTGTTVTFTAAPVNGGGSPTYKWFVNATEQLGETASTFSTTTLNDQDVVTAELTSSITCTTGSPATSNAITITVSGFVIADVTLAASANPVCAGTSVTYTATPTGGGNAPTYEFFVNAVSVQNSASATYSYTPANNDDVYVIMTSSLVCAIGSPVQSASVVMTVNPVPAQPTVTAGGVTTFCNGGSVVLTSSYVGGNQWYENNVLLPGETNDNITVTTSGSYTVVQTAIGCSSVASAPEVVTVNANPTVSITGSATYCTASNTVLSASATAGSGTITGYQWVLDGVTNLGTASTETVSTPGSYTVIVTNSNGCSTTSAALVVSEALLPTASITGAATICTGTTETLTATATAGSGTIATYQWVLNGVTNVGTNLATYDATVAGSYTVIVTNSFGCATTSVAFVLGAVTTPMSGTYTIGSGPASCTNYVNLAFAISDLNTRGVSGNVTFDIASGHTETAPTGGYTINYCGLGDILKPSALQTVTFQGGAIAAMITAGVGTGTFDAMVKLVGTDYITFDKVSLQESAGNTTATTQMEAGYALLKCDGTDGANNNTISNSSITLNKTNTASVGIYQNNHTAASTADLAFTGTVDQPGYDKFKSSNNRFFGNSIQNVYRGIQVIGSQSTTPNLYDLNNSAGIAGTGNTITNFGGGASTSQTMGVFGAFQEDLNILNNTINGGAGNTAAQVNGIQYGNSIGGTISNNTITMTSSNPTSSTLGMFILSGGVTKTITITNNIVENCTLSTASPFTGILTQAGLTVPLNIVITGNTVRNNSFTATTGAATFISNTIVATGSVTISNNTVQNNSLAGTGIFTGIANTSTTGIPTLTVNDNTITGNTKGNTGTMSLLSYGAANNATINNNVIHNNAVSGTTLGATVTLNCAIGGTAVYTFSGNSIYNNRVQGMSGSSVATISGHTNAASPLGETITNNTVHTLFVTGAATPSTGVQVIRAFNNNPLSTTVRVMSGNVMYNLYSQANMNAAITGILSTANQSASIFKNKIYDLYPGQNGTGASVVKGISVTGGTLTNIYNNMIGIDLGNGTPNAVNGVLVGTNSMVGIEVTGGTNVNLRFNTIRLAGNGNTGTFGTSGISLTSTTPIVDIRNNIVVNLTTGGGTGAANTATGLRRTSTAVTGYEATSNNNIWYTGTPAATRSIYYNGTTAYQTIATFKAFIAPRETNSQTEAITFQSIVGANADFQKVSTGSATLVEGGAQAIAGITDDYFGTTRNGSGPDIGAHEDNFPNVALVITSSSIAPSTVQCTATAHTVTVVVAPGIAPVSSVTLNYAYDGVAQTPVVMSNGGSGNTYTGVIPAATTPTNAVVTWSVTASDGTYTPTTAVATYQDNPLLGQTFPISGSPATVCSGSPATLSTYFNSPVLSGAGATTSATYSNPFYSLWSNAHNQHLVLASELQAAGMVAGNITALGINISSAGSLPMLDFSMKIAQTSATDLTNFVSPTFSTVYTSASLLPTTGVNTLTFTAPFNWDGVSNIVVEICHGNAASTATMSRTAVMDVTSFVSTIHTHVTSSPGTSGTTICGDILTNKATYSVRPQFTFSGVKGQNGFTINWYDATNALVGTGATATVNPTVTTVYHAVATDNVTGCTKPSLADVTVSIIPLAAVNITTTGATCASGTTLTANTTGGGTPYNYTWSDGSATVYPNAQTITATLPAGSYTFSVTVTDGCGGSVNMTLPVTVNANPAVSVVSDPVTGQLCGGAATLTASGASTYTWSPALGLSATTGATVLALPTANTTYTVTGTDVNGCTATASQALTVELGIVLNATATPATFCEGNTTQLNTTVSRPLQAKSYIFSSSTGASLDPMTGATTIVSALTDDTPMNTSLGANTTAGPAVPIGFTFNFEGVSYTDFSASPDGWIRLGATTATSEFTNAMTATSNIPKISAFWDDLATGSDGSVSYVVTGAPGSQILKVQWVVRIPRTPLTDPSNSTFQAWLYEANGNVELRYGTMATPPAGTASAGLSGLTAGTNFHSITFATNTSSNVTANDGNTGIPTSGTMYTYSNPASGAIALEWSPAANLNDYTIANPVATGLTPGTYNFIVKATNTATGCYNKDTVVVTVNALPAATFTGLPATICLGASAVTLVGTPSNGNFSGPGISGNSFTPASAGVGTHTITYSVTDISTGCSNSTSQQVTVVNPTVTISGLPATICVNAAAITINGNYSGGTFTGTGITDNLDGTASFNPATAGVGGPYSITYSYTDGNGCSNSISQNITVNALPTVSFTGLPATLCVHTAAITLTGNHGGGTFTGTGITDNANGTASFNPATAGVGGPYTITYSYTDVNGCTNSQSQTITITANFGYANLQWPANGSYCVGGSLTAYGQVYKLGLTEAGGAGAGIVAELGWSTSNTDPATWTNWQAASFNTQVGNNDEYSSALSLPAGTYYYTFRYSLDGCGFQYGGYSAGGGNFWDGTNYVSGVLTVNALPTVSFTGLSASYCINAGAVTLTGNQAPNGTFSGPGITDNANGTASFNPATAGVGGPYSITYTYSDGTCSNSSVQTVTVNALPTVSFSGLALTYCTTDAAVTLTGSPAGGTFSGPGITGTSFDPAAAGAGTHSITYSYTDVNGCSNSSSQNVTVTVCATFATLNLNVFLEGFYSDINTMRENLSIVGISTDPTETDTITVNLWAATSLANTDPDFTIKAVLHIDGTATMQFPAGVSGNSFYIAVKHRNHLETWSANPVAFTTTTAYDFTSSQSQAYDDGVDANPPMAAVAGGKFAIYGGDVNQDFTVDGSDANEVEISANNFDFGYNAADANGDGETGGADANIVEINANLFLFFARPY